ncbi:MAG: BMC domain-containing protein [Eubacteriales bacterium]|nr:BMC domain-containing protein [Eubacteriales bacterium]
MNAIGVIEVSYYSKTVVVLDQMLKAAAVELVSYHDTLGGQMTHGIVAGTTSEVEAAIETAKQSKKIIGEDNLKVAVCVSNPHPEVIKLLNMINQKEYQN